MTGDDWDWVFGAGLVALAVLNVVRWAADRSGEASWNDTPGKAAAPPRSHASRGVFVSQLFVGAALLAIVLLRFFDVLP